MQPRRTYVPVKRLYYVNQTLNKTLCTNVSQERISTRGEATEYKNVPITKQVDSIEYNLDGSTYPVIEEQTIGYKKELGLKSNARFDKKTGTFYIVEMKQICNTKLVTEVILKESVQMENTRNDSCIIAKLVQFAGVLSSVMDVDNKTLLVNNTLAMEQIIVNSPLDNRTTNDRKREETIKSWNYLFCISWSNQ